MNQDPNPDLLARDAKKTSTEPPDKLSPSPSVTIFIVLALAIFHAVQIIADPLAAVRLKNRVEHTGD
jgi:hypothetical protein